MALSQSKFSFKVCHFESVGLGARFFRGEADIFSDWRFNKPVIPFLLFVLAGVSQSTSEGFRLKAVLQTLRVKNASLGAKGDYVGQANCLENTLTNPTCPVPNQSAPFADGSLGS